MGWRHTVNSSRDGTSSREYLWPADAWEAYNATITALEATSSEQRAESQSQRDSPLIASAAAMKPRIATRSTGRALRERKTSLAVKGAAWCVWRAQRDHAKRRPPKAAQIRPVPSRHRSVIRLDPYFSAIAIARSQLFVRMRVPSIV